jgi:hypothetical protein
MTMKFKLLGITFLIIVLNSTYSQDTPKDFDYGRIENSKYVNSFFDFEITLPKDWIIQTKEQMDDMTKRGKAMVAGDDSNMKAILKASEINIANLLSVFQFERGSAVEYNPSFSIVVENIKNLPGIKTGNEYLFQAKKLMEQSQLKYDYIDNEFSKETVNGTDFYKMNAEIKYMGLDIKQIYYVTIKKGFSFVVITTFINDQQKQDLLKSINSMQFKN